jgi:hypothetical protein
VPESLYFLRPGTVTAIDGPLLHPNQRLDRDIENPLFLLRGEGRAHD